MTLNARKVRSLSDPLSRMQLPKAVYSWQLLGPEGEHKQAILGDGADAEEYVKHLVSFDRLLEKKGYRALLADAAKAVLKAGMTLKKYLKVPKGENDPSKATRLTEVKAAEKELTAAKVVESIVACLTYDLIHKLTKDNPEIQWDRIVVDMHSKNPWMDINRNTTIV